jgi:hypothetical protein
VQSLWGQAAQGETQGIANGKAQEASSKTVFRRGESRHNFLRYNFFSGFLQKNDGFYVGLGCCAPN